MNIWSEVITALRGGIDEVGEAIETHQAIELIDEQIRLLNKELQTDKEALASQLVTIKQAEQQIKALEPEIDKFENYAIKALEQDEELALEIAEQIAILEAELTEQQALISQSQEKLEQLRQHIRQTEQEILRLRHQRDTVKASSNVQSIQESISVVKTGKTIKPQTARDVLERIKKCQLEEDSKNDLQSKLKKAGILDDNSEDLVNASKVLERIKGNR